VDSGSPKKDMRYGTATNPYRFVAAEGGQVQMTIQRQTFTF
jgi:hypothetical protein